MVSFIKPSNFSGRTDFLKSWTGFGDANSAEIGLYLGESAADYITGLATTVEDELLIHDRTSDSFLKKDIKEFVEEIKMDKYYGRNPFKLSGGEQCMLAILCGLLFNSNNYAIDTTTEQLDIDWRFLILNFLQNSGFKEQNIIISDNRVAEYQTKIFNPIISVPSNYLIPSLNPHSINFKRVENNWRSAQKISLDSLNFGYERKNPVLKGCTFEFIPGNIYHLSGKNGAGKSTLSKILCGLYKPDAGTIKYPGLGGSLYKYPGKILGYSFQSPDDQLFNSTVKNELLGAFRIKNADIEKKADYLCDFFSLKTFLENHPADLPFVIRKRITLAATLINERDWYVLDEPTVGQDDYFVSQFAQLLEFLAEYGKGIIIVSHSESFIARIKNIKKIELENGVLKEIEA